MRRYSAVPTGQCVSCGPLGRWRATQSTAFPHLALVKGNCPYIDSRDKLVSQAT